MRPPQLYNEEVRSDSTLIGLTQICGVLHVKSLNGPGRFPFFTSNY